MDKKFTVEERYLGDGVYASYDGYHIILDLRAQDDFTKIALEPQVLEALNKYNEFIQESLKEWRMKWFGVS